MNIPCKGGSLRISNGFLSIVSMTGKSIWQVPVNDVTGIEEVSQKILITIIIHTVWGDRTVEWIAPGNVAKLQQSLTASQAMAPVVNVPTNFYNAQTYSSFRAPARPTISRGRVHQQRQRFNAWLSPKSRKFRFWFWVLSVAGILFLCALCANIGNVMNASIAGTSMPTPTVSATQVVQSVDSPTVQIRPTNTPVSVPTPTPIPPTPKPVPTRAPQPTPTPHSTGLYGNPWGYDFNPGHLITNPPADFCSYFPCIATFIAADDPDGGYIVECQDGTFSQSGGESGSCSHHGGNLRPLYSH